MHEMRLHNEPFVLIRNGTKTIELRLNDEKRRQIKVGDTITFINRSNNEQISTVVINLHKYASFEELYKHFDKVSLGYKEDEIADPKDMELYYSREEQDKYGVVGIEISLLNDVRYKKEHYQFLFRTSAIIYNKDKSRILLFNSEGRDFYMLPGGKIQELETSEHTLIREIKEEIGYDISNIKFKAISEEKAYDKKLYNHQIEIIYECIYNGEIDKLKFHGKEGEWITFEWISIDSLDNYKLLPKEIMNVIKSNKNHITEGF